MEDYKIELLYPRKIGGVEVKVLTFRRLVAGDRMRVAMQTKGESDNLVRALKINRFMACSLCNEGLTPEDYDALDGGDSNAIDILIDGMLNPPTATAEA